MPYKPAKKRTNYSHKARLSFAKAIEKRYPVDKWVGLWTEILETDGPAKAVQLFAHFVPAEMNIVTGDAAEIPVIGVVPETNAAWDAQFGAKDAITVDSESGEVLQ